MLDFTTDKTQKIVCFLKFNYYYFPLTYSSFSLENVYIWGFFKNCLGFDTVYCITHIYVIKSNKGEKWLLQ